MANTYVDYTGDGSETDFAITFDYIKTAHVAVEINDGPAGGTNKWVRKTLGAGADYTVVTSPAKKVVFNSAPANSVKIRVLRDSDANTGIVDFANGSVLTETELDNSYQHNRYLAEEAEEGKTGGALVKDETSGQFDADALRLENLADPDSDDDAVNKGYADNRYVDADGDTMRGELTLINSDPTNDNHAARKKYVDDQDALQVTKTGDTMSGALTLPNSDPTDGNHATRKTYVDAEIATALATGVAGGPIDTVNVADDAITYAKLQNVAANNVLLGNDNGAGADVQELTATEARTLLNVEDGATADQSASEIKTAYESNSDTNAFTDADQTKLTNIEDNANNYSHPNHSGDVTSVGDGALTLATVNSDVGSFTNANITVNGKGLITAASSGSGAVSKYSTGWFNNTTGLSNGGTYTFTHNLGTTDINVTLWMATDSSGSNQREVNLTLRWTGAVNSEGGGQILNVSTTQLTVQLAEQGWLYLDSNGDWQNGNWGTTHTYIKVVAIG
jgi:hypothetical protein